MLAVWKSGAACLPIDPAWPPDRLRFLIRDAGCSGLLIDSFNAPHLPDEAVRVVVAVDEQTAIIAGTAALASPLSPGDLAYVIYTSGSTGLPKGVEVSHGNLANLIEWHITAFTVIPQTRAAYVSSIGFDAGLWEVWPYLCAGASVSIVPDLERGSASALSRWLVEQSIDIAFAPTVLAEQLITMAWPSDSALRTLLTGADTLVGRPPPGLPFTLVNNYGPTECTVVATSGSVAASGSERPSIGRPINNCDVYLLDEAQSPVANGMIGEVYIGGAGVGLGYRGLPDLTAERFVPNPWSDDSAARLYRTGDLASRDERGELRFHGRIDDQVKIRGHRVEPEEVAAVLLKHDLVSAAAVIAGKDGAGAMTLTAYLVLADRLLSSEAIREHLANFLPDYLIPATFVRLDHLPLTRNGKLDKLALPAPSLENQLSQNAYRAPTSPAEQRLVEILTQVMNREQVGLDDNFFLIGGHSLLGTQIVLRASEAFGIDLTLRDLFDAPTARRLAKLLEQRVIDAVSAMSDEQAIRLSAA
ncbi:MAG: hypothetical protein NVS3B5_06410 [Sphingomicrobium sp.]